MAEGGRKDRSSAWKQDERVATVLLIPSSGATCGPNTEKRVVAFTFPNVCLKEKRDERDAGGWGDGGSKPEASASPLPGTAATHWRLLPCGRGGMRYRGRRLGGLLLRQGCYRRIAV